MIDCSALFFSTFHAPPLTTLVSTLTRSLKSCFKGKGTCWTCVSSHLIFLTMLQLAVCVHDLHIKTLFDYQNGFV